MNDSTKKYTPDRLYRDYQSSRDNIPEGLFNELISKAQQRRHEDSIYQILQQAKVAEGKPDTSPTLTHDEKRSFADQVKNLLGFSSPKAWGTAFASVALAVIVLPIAMNSSSQYSQVSHLDGCANCVSYINNASVVTRSAIAGPNSPSPQAKMAAKLGRINANLKISTTLEDESILQASISELQKLAAKDTQLYKALQSNDVRSSQLIGAIEESVTETSLTKMLSAAETIHIAHITARFALNEGQSDNVDSTLSAAISALSSIDNPTRLQQSILDEMQLIEKNPNLSERSKLEKSIEVYGRAMKSLGA